MTVFQYVLDPPSAPNIGLIVLQTDERIEQDFRRLLPNSANLYVSRVPSGLDVSPESLQEMEAHIPASACLLPASVRFDAVGYGCTSGTAQIGQHKIRELVNQGVHSSEVSEPLSALLAACSALDLSRLAFLSPYVEDVSNRLRNALQQGGIETPVFGTFSESEEAKVARIAPKSIHSAAEELVKTGDVDGIFLSCTNLNTLDIIAPLEAATGLPVLSSNQVLAWHLCRLAQCAGPLNGQGQLFQAA